MNLLRKVIEGFGNWSDVPSRSVEDNLVEVLTQHGITQLLPIKIDLDPYDSSRQVVTLSSPTFTSPSLSDDETSFRDRVKEICAGLESFNVSTITSVAELFGRPAIASDADQIIRFTDNMKKLISSQKFDYSLDYVQSLEMMTLAELKERVKDMDFEYLVRKVFSRLNLRKDLNAYTTIVVENIEYLIKFAKLIKETDDTVVNNFLGWMLIVKNAWLTTLREEFISDIESQELMRENVVERCLDQMMKHMPMVVGRLYVDRFFSDEDMNSSDKIVNEVMSAFKNKVAQNNWLDAETKRAALEKANSMTLRVGFPNWIKNDTELSDKYPLVSYDPYAF